MYVDMCTDVCADMCIDMPVGKHVHMCIDTCAGMSADIYTDMRIAATQAGHVGMSSMPHEPGILLLSGLSHKCL